MKEQLTTEQIARVFAMYLGCPLQTLEYVNELNYLSGVEGVYTIRDKEGFVYEYDQCKLLLHPISSITDEELEEIAIMWGAAPHLTFLTTDRLREMLTNDEADLVEILDDMSMNMLGCFYLVQYLTQKGFAIPLYFSPNHPCNGKDAIELGLAVAIDSPKSVEPK
jgi:hypothetical protein